MSVLVSVAGSRFVTQAGAGELKTRNEPRAVSIRNFTGLCYRLYTLHLGVFQLKGSFSTKNLYHHFELLLFAIHFFNFTGKTNERSVIDLHGFAYHEIVQSVIGRINEFVGCTEHSHYLALAKGLGKGSLVASAKEVDNVSCVSEFVKHFAMKDCLDKNIAGIEILFLNYLLPLRIVSTFSVGIST